MAKPSPWSEQSSEPPKPHPELEPYIGAMRKISDDFQTMADVFTSYERQIPKLKEVIELWPRVGERLDHIIRDLEDVAAGRKEFRHEKTFRKLAG